VKRDNKESDARTTYIHTRRERKRGGRKAVKGNGSNVGWWWYRDGGNEGSGSGVV
jgi:hypothetical protein